MIYLTVILLVVIEATFLNVIKIAGIKPDILLIFVVFIGLNKGPYKAAAAGLLAGFLKDALSAGGLLNTVFFPVGGILVGIFAERFYRERKSVSIWIVFLASLFLSIIYLFWFSQWYYPPSIFILAFHTGLPGVAYTTLISPIIFYWFNKLFYAT